MMVRVRAQSAGPVRKSVFPCKLFGGKVFSRPLALRIPFRAREIHAGHYPDRKEALGSGGGVGVRANLGKNYPYRAWARVLGDIVWADRKLSYKNK